MRYNNMTNAQLNGYLELIAKLIEAQAITALEAAELVRQAKVPERETKKNPPPHPEKVK